MGDWGKRIKIIFGDDGGGSALYNINSGELAPLFRIVEMYGAIFYATSVSIGENPNELLVNFSDFNDVIHPFQLEYLGGGLLRGQDLKISPFVLTPYVQKLNRKGDYEYINVGISILGENAEGFDGKLYFSESTAELVSFVTNGTNAYATRINLYHSTNCAELTTIAINGTYADAGGTPI